MSESGFPSIIRVHKTGNFVMLPKEIVWNPAISLKAKGLLAAVLAFPEGRSPARHSLGRRMKESNHALKTACQELCQHGYAHFETTRDSLGQFRSGYHFFESPDLNPFLPSGESDGITSYCIELEGNSPATEKCHPVGPHWGRSLEDWIERLREQGCKPREKSNGMWEALCPCHEDSVPSLCVTAGEVKAVVAFCHAGCMFDDIVQFLFGGELENSSVYTYCDEHDRPKFRIVRDPDKKEFLTQVFEDERFVTSTGDGLRRIPYRLPQLIAAIRKREPVWIVEGEKDAETMRRKGTVATCNPFGAGKWSSELNVWFKGANVTIVADKDLPGLRHARMVADALSSVAGKIRIVKAAGDDSVNDATDHFAAGFGMHDFVVVPKSELP